MKRYFTWMSLFVLALGLACASPAEQEEGAPYEAPAEVTREDVEREVSEAYAAARDYSHSQREDLVRWSNEQIEALEAQMATIEERMAEAPEASREAWQATRETLNREKEALERQIESLVETSPEAWEEVKSTTFEAMDELERGLEEFTRKLSDQETSEGEG